METLAELQNEYKGLDRDQLLKLVLVLKSENAVLRQIQYSSKRENRFLHAKGQGKLFNEAEHCLAESSAGNSSEDQADSKPSDTDKPSGKQGSKPRKKRKKTLSDDLPRIRQVVDLPEDQRICPVNGGKLSKVGESVVEKLEFIPAKAVVISEATINYKCDCCEENNFHGPVKEPSPIPGSFATASLIAAVLSYKFIDGLPLYRQQRIFGRYGVDIHRTTLASWVVKMGDLFQPLVNSIHEDLLTQKNLHADETPVQVLNEKNKKAKSKSYMWTLGCSGEVNAVFFKYYPNRTANSAIDLLAGFKGTLTCDGYSSYIKAAKTLGFQLSGCLAHIRRKFFTAEKQALQAKPKKEPKASQALDYIASLYRIEKEANELPPDKRLVLRKAKSKPIFDQFEEWLLDMKLKILPSSPTGKAIAYALNQWCKMELFLRDGNVSIDNNFMERSIRPFVIGRKAWLFSQSVNGAEASAGIYTLVESAKLNLLDPADYLTLIIKELPKVQSTEELSKLLPYNVSKHHKIKSYIASL